MKKISVLFMSVILLASMIMVSCEKEDHATLSTGDDDNTTLQAKKKPNNGKGKPGPDPEPDPEPEDPFVATYQILEYDDFDALYRFSISQSGTLMLLQTDPTITSWGTDLWGSWADPYPFSNNVVNYIKGLTNVTYEFTPLPNNKYDVKETLLVAHYNAPTLPPDTTIKHIGIYQLLP